MRLTFIATTWNLCRKSDPRAIERELRDEMSHPNVRVIFLQEAKNFAGLALRLCSESGGAWAMLDAREDGVGDRDARQNLILYRTDTLRLEHDHWIDVEDRSHFDRWITVGNFSFVGNPERRLLALGTHFNPHVERPAWWRLPRFGDFKAHVDRLAHRAGRAPGGRQVLAAADFNVNFARRFVNRVKAFPTRRLATVGMRSNWDVLGLDAQPTKGGRFIDAVFFRLLPWFQPVRHATHGGESDHRKLRVAFVVTL